MGVGIGRPFHYKEFQITEDGRVARMTEQIELIRALWSQEKVTHQGRFYQVEDVKLGIHPVHLGILMVVNMEVGMCHPPVGLNLYVASGIAKMGITELTIAVWPWLLTMLIFLGVVTYVPELSLWLPRALGML